MKSMQQIQKILKDWALWNGLCDKEPNLNQVTPLVDGLTNSNWLLKVENEQGQDSRQYVIRINATNNLALKLNRQTEWDMHQSISHYNICPAYLYRDPNDIYWIRPFLKNHALDATVNQNKDFINSDFLKAIASHFKIIHNIPTSNNWPKINFSELINHYWQQIAEKQINTENTLTVKLTGIREQLDQNLQGTNYTPCLCHMDPNPSNWILDNTKIHLIDWEYAALGNKAWDLAVFCDTCDLSQEQTELLLKHYKDIDKQDFNLASKQMKYLSTVWYYVQGHLADDTLLEKLSAIQNT